jgi:putative transposase
MYTSGMKIQKIHPPPQRVVLEQVPLESVFQLYTRVLSREYFEQLSQQLGIATAKSIFNWMTIIYGMILQRLSSKGTLNAIMADLISVLDQFSDHRRVRDKTVSANPGGFCRARGRMAMSVVEGSFDHLFETLHRQGIRTADEPSEFLLDGTTLTLQATPELKKVYPPARNQHGESHWPIMRVVVAHSLRTGFATRPAWSSKDISEQVLADQAIEYLPPGSTIIADRNFGVFSTAYHAFTTGHPVILRMTEARAQALGGHGLNNGMDLKVTWTPSAWERKNHPHLPDEAQISGRLVVQKIEHNDKVEKLYLFTTREDPAEALVTLYGKRWNVETDLRSLKRTVRLHTLNTETPDMVAKELVIGVAAYNIVHMFMNSAAEKTGLEPRDLSFSRVQDFVYAALPILMRTTSPEEIDEQLQLLLQRIASCKLPRRKKRRSYPRKVWMRRRTFPPYPTAKRESE